MWGVLDIDRTGTDHYNASQIGKPVWDNIFNIILNQSCKILLFIACRRTKIIRNYKNLIFNLVGVKKVKEIPALYMLLSI